MVVFFMRRLGLRLLFLFLGENHRASVQVVVTAYHFSRSGLDCLFQDRFRRAQALRDIFNIRFYGGFEVGTASRLHRGLDLAESSG